MNKEPEINENINPDTPLGEQMPVGEAEEVISSPDVTSDEIETTEDAPETTEGEASAEETPKKTAFDALKSLFDYVEVFAFAILAVLLIFTFCFRLCRVDGNSMNNTLTHGELLVTTNIFYEPQQGDVIVFHLSNNYYRQPLVKRVIATEGQTVEIDFVTGEVKVDGTPLNEDYIFVDGGEYDIRSEFNNKYLIRNDEGNVVGFAATVPEGHVFAMGDNRNHSTDSRAVSVGFVNEDCILGKALIRVAPFTVFN